MGRQMKVISGVQIMFYSAFQGKESLHLQHIYLESLYFIGEHGKSVDNDHLDFAYHKSYS